MASGERTEAATPRRLEELRSRGSIPRSQDLNAAVTLLAGFLLLHYFGGQLGERLRGLVVHYLALSGQLELTESTVPHLAQTAGLLFLGLVAPIFLLLPVVGVFAGLGQVGPLFALRAAAPDVSRVNPLNGIKRLFSVQSLVELLKVMAKAAILVFIIGRGFVDRVPEIIALGSSDLRAAAPWFGAMVIELGIAAAAALLVLAVLDYGYQRWEYQRTTRMTRDELREELRQTEGRPEIRSRVRGLQRRLATARMMASVPKADVIIANPTHFAVALAYRPGEMAAPRVLAKGADLVAQRIKDRAQQHGIPIVENPPLAQALYRTVEIGAEIPVSLFQAVAEVLAYIYSLRHRNSALEHAGD
jgi:flagellar biosynthetic protein FlhB